MDDDEMYAGKSSTKNSKENKYEAEEKKWKAEADLRTLIDAEKIKGDPDRLKAAMTCKREQMDALKNLKS